MTTPGEPHEKHSTASSPRAVEKAHDKALAALQKLAKPQPRAAEPGTARPTEPQVGSGSATGFVGMLARPTGVSNSSGGSTLGGYALPMAREVAHETPGNTGKVISKTTTDKDLAPRPALPRGYRIALVPMVVLALLLALIGMWAIGALAYIAQVTPAAPTDIHYPLLVWGVEEGTYAGSSRMTAWLMLACLPVSAVMLLIARIMQKKLRVTRR